MEYNIKKGDNIVTKDGRVYRLLFASKLGTEWYLIFDSGENTKSEHIITRNLEEHFNRIGKYDFTNTIKPLTNEIINVKNGLGITIMRQRNISSHEDVVDKINEIIEYINKEK